MTGNSMFMLRKVDHFLEQDILVHPTRVCVKLGAYTAIYSPMPRAEWPSLICFFGSRMIQSAQVFGLSADFSIRMMRTFTRF